MVVVGDVLVGAIIGKLVGTAYDYIADKVKDRVTRSNMKAEVDKLKANLPKIQAVLSAADKTGITLDEMEPGLSAWMWQLRDAIDAADNLLDDIEYQKLDKQFELEEKTGLTEVDLGYESDSKGVKMCCSAFISKCTMKNMKHVFIDDPILVRLREIVKELDEVAAHIGEFVQLVAFSEQCTSRDNKHVEIAKDRETGFLPNEKNLFGREEEKEELTKWLLGSRSSEESKFESSVLVLAIIGVGGIGKTSLAQDIYNDDRMNGYFSKKIWICVSNTFDVPTILGKIVRTSEQSLSTLQEEVQKTLSLERFLLVLDDVWDDENRGRWEKLVVPLQSGKFGSKIIITTRMGSVAKMARDVIKGSEYLEHNLKGLNIEMSERLLDKHAFSSVDRWNYSNLQPIIGEISKKLGGVPLLLKTVGGILNSYLDYGHWISILNSNALNLEMNENKVLNVLKLSYQDLPMQLRGCFRFCSIFPEDYGYTKEELVGMWVALGMIPQSQNEHEHPEDIGEKYFNILVRKSFFMDNYTTRFGRKCYVMHDCVHQMASILSKGECLGTSNVSLKNIPETIRHLCIKYDDFAVLVNISPRNLRTLVIVNFVSNQEVSPTWNKIFKSLNNLRVLKLHGYEMHDLSVVDADFQHLRYVDIISDSYTLHRIPNCFGKLYHLQMIHLGLMDIKSDFACESNPVYSEITMHGSFFKLRKLRHFYVSNYSRYWAPVFFPGIGRLLSLNDIGTFTVKDENGYKLSELKNMNNLNSSLEITGLETVRNNDEAKEAKLNEKKRLCSLILEWTSNVSPLGDNYRRESNAQLSDFLKPPCNLNALTFKGYGGLRPPCWLETGYPKNLVSLSFTDCGDLSQLPHIGCFRFLKFLELNNLPLLKRIPPMPLNLEKLELTDVGLVSLPTISLDRESTSLVASASLSSLVISDCPNLRSLGEGLFGQQNLLTALKELQITNCKELVVPFPDVGFTGLISLRFLEIEFNQSPEIIPSMPANILPSSLEKLTVRGQVEGVLNNLLRGLTSLSELQLAELNPHSRLIYSLKVTICEDLEIIECGKLKSLDNLYVPTSLQGLEVKKCPKLVLVAFQIEDNQSSSALEEIFIRSCDELRSIENLPSLISVQDIVILDCPNLVSINKSLKSESNQGIMPSTVNNSLAMNRSVIRELRDLRLLRIDNCAKLASLSFMVGLKSVNSLSISYCPELASLSFMVGLKYVESLTIFRCPNLLAGAVLEENPVTDVGQRFSKNKDNILSVTNLYLDCASLLLCHPFRKNTSVKNLTLYGHLHPIPESFLWQNRTSLKILVWDNCSHVDSLHDLTVLEELYISGAKELKTLPELPNSLKKLYISGAKELKTLPELPNSLKILYISGAKELKTLPKLPRSLEQLYIKGCTSELKRLYMTNTGENWPKISYIPYIRITQEGSF